jgi:hypothetical protein
MGVQMANTKRQKRRKQARTAALTRKGLGIKTARRIANGKRKK